MFVNCPSCRALVATDPATDLPPERCPRCAGQMRDGAHVPAVAEVPEAADDARGNMADAITGILHAHDPADATLATLPAVSLATLLQGAPDLAPSADPEHPAPAPVDSEPRADADADAASAPPAAAAIPEVSDVPDVADLQEVAKVPQAPEIPETTTADLPAVAAGTRRAPGRAAPSFARRRTAIASDRSHGRRWLLPAAIVGLTVLLALQWLVADRARLAADPGWRPLVAGTCAVLQCSLPPWHEPSAIMLLERDVRPHPDAADALRITASFRNDAAWPQPWPELVLTLSDIDGRPLGARVFMPAEYLAGAPPSDLLDSGQGAVIRMDVLDPGAGAVGFAFDFR